MRQTIDYVNIKMNNMDILDLIFGKNYNRQEIWGIGGCSAKG